MRQPSGVGGSGGSGLAGPAVCRNSVRIAWGSSRFDGWQRFTQPAMQLRLCLYLGDRTSDPVHIGSHRLDAVRAQPAEQVAGSLIAAMAEDFRQSFGFARDVRQQFVRVAVAIRHETKISRLLTRQSRIIIGAILQRVVREHREAGEMYRLEFLKRYKPIGRISEPRSLRESHLRQARSQIVDAIGRHFCDDNEIVLWSHAPFRLYGLKSSEKSINRALSQ